MKYKKSMFNHCYQTDTGIILFNASNMNLVKMNESEYSVFKAYDCFNDEEISDNTLQTLVEQGMYVIYNLDEKELEKKRRSTRRKCAREIRKNTIGFLRVSLTEQCNLRCKYCFVNTIMDHKSKIKQNDLIELMTWFLNIPYNRNPLVQYFGGEPLIEMEKIKFCHDFMSSYLAAGKIDSFREEIVTNGLLVTAENAKYFVDSNISLSFSIDGWKELNDKNRVDVHGNGSYDRIVAGLRNYVAAGGKASAIITPTDDNLPYFNEVVRFLDEELKCTEISVNTPQPRNDGWHVDGKKLAFAMQQCLDYCNTHSIQLNHPANNIVFLINSKIPQTNSCMNLTYGQDINTWGIYVTSELLVSKCVVECDARCTSRFEEFMLDDDFLRWHFDDNINEPCFSCPGLNICGGGCSIERVLAEGKNNIEKCRFYKEMIPWIIKYSG